MASNRPAREVPSSPPDAGANDLPLDHALSLLLADETENALRWGAAVLESGPWTPSALVVTARLLDQMGRKRAAIEGLNLAVQQATAEGNLPLALAAIGDLRTLGADVEASLDQIAGAFCVGSERIEDTQSAPLLPQLGEFRPLSPFLTGPALASKAVQIVESARRTGDDVGSEAPSRIAPLPLFSALGREALHDLLAAFDTLTVPAGHAVITEGEEEAAAYIVARGELEVSRRSTDENGKPVVLARLASGAFFGEMALLSQLPGAASVIATRPSILLVARREALEAVVERHPEVAVELAAHCRRQSVANLGWASPVVVAIPARERAALVERFQTRMFEAGDRLVESGEAALGLHLIVSGEIAVVAHEAGERVVLATLTAGETVGEVELVLCRNAAADAIAVRPTATLFLQRDEFFALVQDHPAILHGLYGIAVRRHGETSLALEAGAAALGDDSLLRDDEPTSGRDESLLGPVPGDLTALVEDPFPAAAPPSADPPRITPLARGTLGLSRARSTPPPAIPAPAPSSARPPPASVRPALPLVRTPPRGTSVPFPPPPPPIQDPPTAAPASPAAASPGPASYRRTLPPPIPLPAPPSARSGSTQPGVGRVSSFAPVMASDDRKSTASPARSNAPQWVAVGAIAAAAVAFIAIRGSNDTAVTSPASAPPVAATVLPVNPEPAVTARDLPTEPAVLAMQEVAKPKVHAPPVFAKTPPKVIVEPNPVPGPAPATSPSPANTAAAAAPPAPPPSRTSFPPAKPAVADQALTAGEFGGRE
jgi:CRP-like cAMP-binding protein